MFSLNSTFRSLTACAALVIAVAPATLHAQSASRPRVGALIGLSSTSVSDADVDGLGVLGVDANTKRRMGFQIGAYLTQSLSGNLSFQPEVHYIQKGAKIAVSVTDIEGQESPFSAEASLKFAYLEVPLLLRYDMNEGNSVRPFIVFGPAVAFRISCNIGFKVEGASLNSDCASQFDEETESEDPFKKFDAGGIVGAGISGTLGARPVSLQLRYSHGLINIANDATDGQSPRNTGISLLFGVGF